MYARLLHHITVQSHFFSHHISITFFFHAAKYNAVTVDCRTYSLTLDIAMRNMQTLTWREWRAAQRRKLHMLQAAQPRHIRKGWGIAKNCSNNRILRATGHHQPIATLIKGFGCGNMRSVELYTCIVHVCIPIFVEHCIIMANTIWSVIFPLEPHIVLYFPIGKAKMLLNKVSVKSLHKITQKSMYILCRTFDGYFISFPDPTPKQTQFNQQENILAF